MKHIFFFLTDNRKSALNRRLQLDSLLKELELCVERDSPLKEQSLVASGDGPALEAIGCVDRYFVSREAATVPHRCT